jgi:spore coat polysaccharide biosynthesis protein SpsF (cytidylyltransferase family)
MENRSMNGTVAIIQARMSSSRFPGKVLEPLLGRPMILFMVERVRKARRVDAVIVATSTDSSDDRLADALHDAGIEVHRGSLKDVLNRFLGAARARCAARIVRLTGDCPLIDADLIDAVLALMVDQGLDYASNVAPPRWPDGLDVEAMTIEALEAAAQDAALASEREHVTPFLRKHPERFRQASLPSAMDLSGLRWTVDHPEDLAFVRQLLAAAGVSDAAAFDRFDLLRALDKAPSLLAINRRDRNEGYATSIALEAGS